MAEMQGKTVAELLGCVPPNTPMSDNEFQWWVARSKFKPLPAIREDIYAARDVYFSMGNSGKPTARPFKTMSKATIDWFTEPDQEDTEFMDYVKQVTEENKTNG